MPYDRTHNFSASFIVELPFRQGQAMGYSGIGVEAGGRLAVERTDRRIFGHAVHRRRPRPFERAGQQPAREPGEAEVAILGGTGPNQSYFDPLAFAPVTTASVRDGGLRLACAGRARSISMAGLFREFAVTERWNVQFRAEALNVTNTPHFANPGANVSNMVLNNDGTHPEPGRIHGDHKHDRHGTGRHRRADVPARSANHVLSGRVTERHEPVIKDLRDEVPFASRSWQARLGRLLHYRGNRK